MKLSLPTGDIEKGSSAHDEATTHASIDVTFCFSNELANETQSISVGDTFAQVKKRIADAKGIPYGQLKLLLDAKELIDPYCLSDVPALTGKESATIQVQVAQ